MLPVIQERTRLWFFEGEKPAGFAFVDDFDNLVFWIEPEAEGHGIGAEMVGWGLSRLREHGWELMDHNLVASSSANSPMRVVLRRNGFIQTETRTLEFERSLSIPIPSGNEIPGFRLRPVKGEAEVDQLVDLHRAAFASEHMTRGIVAMMSDLQLRAVDGSCHSSSQWNTCGLPGLFDRSR